MAQRLTQKGSPKPTENRQKQDTAQEHVAVGFLSVFCRSKGVLVAPTSAQGASKKLQKGPTAQRLTQKGSPKPTENRQKQDTAQEHVSVGFLSVFCRSKGVLVAPTSAQGASKKLQKGPTVQRLTPFTPPRRYNYAKNVANVHKFMRGPIAPYCIDCCQKYCKTMMF